ncbi:hypothetical protein V6N12_061808 [Hibiscus sabdariffa]|uniref:Uncharacterized protein n=1 Tax=Hibiscus sabdariffa TaxID=183260 RepID=A0ABR2DY53_9ROSI
MKRVNYSIIMEITAVAESEFKTNAPSTKAVVDQLLRVARESKNPMQPSDRLVHWQKFSPDYFSLGLLTQQQAPSCGIRS